MPANWNALGGFRFGDSAAMADHLLALIIAGRKTATSWAAREGPKIKLGWRLTVQDSAGRDRALIRIDGLQCRAFSAVDSDFASAEGEGDLSLSNWQATHRSYFERNGGFEEETDLWCCRFTLLDHI